MTNTSLQHDHAFMEEAAISALEFGKSSHSREPLAQAAKWYRGLMSSPALDEEAVPRVAIGFGEALLELGTNDSNDESLVEAIEVLSKVLRQKDRISHFHRVKIMNYLGSAQALLADLKGNENDFRRSIETFKTVLAETERSEVPIEWAKAKNNLGNALAGLGEQNDDPQLLLEAISAYREALEEYTRDRLPENWAKTQMNLGIAIQCLSGIENESALLDDAIGCFKHALTYYSREDEPHGWAKTHLNLGTALTKLGKHAGSVRALEEAIAVISLALEVFNKGDHALDWAAARNNLGDAYHYRGRALSDSSDLTRAVDQYAGALTIYSLTEHPFDYAMSSGMKAMSSFLIALANSDLLTARQAQTELQNAYSLAFSAEGHKSLKVDLQIQLKETTALLRTAN